MSTKYIVQGAQIFWSVLVINNQICFSTSVSPSTGRSRPPVSVASTEATAVASDRSPPMQERKRAREIKVEDDPRPSNRPRSENSEPIQKDAPAPRRCF